MVKLNLVVWFEPTWDPKLQRFIRDCLVEQKLFCLSKILWIESEMNSIEQIGALNSIRILLAGPSLIAVFKILRKLSWINIHHTYLYIYTYIHTLRLKFIKYNKQH